MTEPSAPAGWLPRSAPELFGEGATAAEAYGLLTADVPSEAWVDALTVARDELGCTYFDWLSAVDEPGTGFHVCAHVVALPDPGTGTPLRRLLVRTTVPHEAPVLATATGVYAGAAWHERETHEMFGVGFTGHPHLAPLLLPDAFEGHPLRKDFVLAARVAKAWPGAKEPGESGHGGPKRRQMLPPGVPDPNEWGPLKGQLPPAPARPARSRAGAGATDRPRRARSAGAGSASQRTPGEAAPEAASAAAPEAAPKDAASPAAPDTAAPPATGGEPAPGSGPAPGGDAPWHKPAPAADEGTGEGQSVGEGQSAGGGQSAGEGQGKGESTSESKGEGQGESKGKAEDENGEREGEED
ncbi:NADH-quinone oxidoreductase subunit C [Streptomyces iconiensis]|uniref:NADH-quinone oxidoreductase subunit C n=1 Tax=Streptomyces iconiensis TaxID=1384038 RepID=A0ABT6ZYL0_9ACTN|nr:NADH-quinone oxidoreductase subunit C [Streptomyces iconiensis]MDJ1133721.1 NADH-quinone oxidoreductase subunit C [Streptomyces iconiensis]